MTSDAGAGQATLEFVGPVHDDMQVSGRLVLEGYGRTANEATRPMLAAQDSGCRLRERHGIGLAREGRFHVVFLF